MNDFSNGDMPWNYCRSDKKSDECDNQRDDQTGGRRIERQYQEYRKQKKHNQRIEYVFLQDDVFVQEV
jgi:hypothetical protein